jgi:hypothetical protein
MGDPWAPTRRRLIDNAQARQTFGGSKLTTGSLDAPSFYLNFPTFYLRHPGKAKLTDPSVAYNIDIEENVPVDSKDGWPASPPSDKKGAISLHGFCGIGVQKPEVSPMPPKVNSRIIVRVILAMIGVVLVVLFFRRTR